MPELVGLKAAAIAARAHAAIADAATSTFILANRLRESVAWEERFFAVIVFGDLAATHVRARRMLLELCVDDDDWRVNEALAKAFDAYCSALGYERAIPAIKRALASPHARLRRAASEGLRPWTSARRAYFAARPELAVELLGRLRDDPDRAVQESVGNALRDVWHQHPTIVASTVDAWLRDKPDSVARQTIARHARRVGRQV